MSEAIEGSLIIIECVSLVARKKEVALLIESSQRICDFLKKYLDPMLPSSILKKAN